MKTLFTSMLLIGALFCFAQNDTYAPDQLIIKFKKQGDAIKFANQPGIIPLNDIGLLTSLTLTGNRKEGKTFLLQFASAIDIEKAIASINTQQIDFVEPNYIGYAHGMMGITPNDTYFASRQWSHFNDGSFILSEATEDADIDTDLAWELTQGDPDMVIAILDSGMKLDHPEVEGRIWTNPNELSDSSDNDTNGYIDDVYAGWDFANEDNDPTDDHGHGTNVAGICVATGNNAQGYAGMNWNSQVMICKILNDDNFGFYSWWADAIYYAVDNGADVINMSVGGDGPSGLLEDAINYAYTQGVPVVVSVGNGNTAVQYPAGYDAAFAIGSTNSNDERTVPFFWDTSSGSNYGPELDFVAPGNYMYGLHYLSNTNYGSYWGGTSQAAPHVAGLISLMLSLNPDLTIDEIQAILEDTSEDGIGEEKDTPGWDPYYGHGRINAFEALSHPLIDGIQTATAELKTHKVRISPNPVNFGQDISIHGLASGKLYDLQLFSADGQLAQRFSLGGDENLSLSPQVPAGIYLLKINSNNKKDHSVHKIIVQLQ